MCGWGGCAWPRMRKTGGSLGPVGATGRAVGPTARSEHVAASTDELGGQGGGWGIASKRLAARLPTWQLNLAQRRALGDVVEMNGQSSSSRVFVQNVHIRPSRTSENETANPALAASSRRGGGATHATYPSISSGRYACSRAASVSSSTSVRNMGPSDLRCGERRHASEAANYTA